MRRIGHIWPRVVAFDNLYLAFRKARQGSGRSAEATRFALELEANLLGLQRDLVNGVYRPGAYRQFTIYERKPRVISAAPFRDRVVHHALLNPIEPLLDRCLIHDCYACRKGKGVHAAVDRYQSWARRYRYAMKLDVSRYFPSIDHRLLKRKLRRRLKDERVLDLFDRIIDGGPSILFEGRRRGIPIGNLTSQFFANLYLDGLDHYIKEQLGVRAYLRYVDDLILLDDDKRRLARWRRAIIDRLLQERIALHPRKIHIMPTRLGVDVLGYRVFPDFRLLRNDNGFRFGRRLRRLQGHYARGRVGLSEVHASVVAWVGHAANADTLGLRGVLLGRAVFWREGVR